MEVAEVVEEDIVAEEDQRGHSQLPTRKKLAKEVYD